MTSRYDNLIKNNPLMATIKFSRYKFIAKLLHRNDRVLEIGCSDGVSSNFFSKYVKSVDGIDFDEEAINEAKENFPHIHFEQANALEFRTDKVYDTIIMLDFIEHFNQEDGKKLVEKYSKILSDKGMLIVGTPSKHFEKYRAEHNKLHHLHEYYPDELNQLMEEYFERIMVFSMNDEIVHTGNQNLAWFLFSVGTYVKK